MHRGETDARFVKKLVTLGFEHELIFTRVCRTCMSERPFNYIYLMRGTVTVLYGSCDLFISISDFREHLTITMLPF